MSLASNAPLRLPLLAAAEVRRAVACPVCGAEPGAACIRRLGPLRADQQPANHQARRALAQARTAP